MWYSASPSEWADDDDDGPPYAQFWCDGIVMKYDECDHFSTPPSETLIPWTCTISDTFALPLHMFTAYSILVQLSQHHNSSGVSV